MLWSVETNTDLKIRNLQKCVTKFNKICMFTTVMQAFVLVIFNDAFINAYFV
jgi:hypothetical protein